MRDVSLLPNQAAIRETPVVATARRLARRLSGLWGPIGPKVEPLAGGAPIRIVQLGPEDRGLILLHYLTLGSADRQVRFHGRVRYASLLDRYRQIDWKSTQMLGAVAGNRLVGIAELAATVLNRQPCTELAVSVLGAWQNRGLATVLLQSAISEVHQQQHHQAILFTQLTNRAMVRVCRKLGGKAELSLGEFRFTFDAPAKPCLDRDSPPSG